MVVFFFILYNSCENGETNYVWILANETQCANPWDSFAADSVEEKVTIFLRSEGIEVYEINIEDQRSDSMAICAACFCVTGRIIHALIEEDDFSQAESFGFELPTTNK